MELNLRRKLFKCNIWSTDVYGAKMWTLREADNKYLEKFWNVVLMKDGKYQLAGSCEKLRRITQSEGEKGYRIKQKKEG